MSPPEQAGSWIIRVLISVVCAASTLGGCGTDLAEKPRTFAITALESPTGPGSSVPNLALTADGRAVLSWLEEDDDQHHTLKFAILDGDRWSTPTKIAASADWFINWADFASVVPITATMWAAHWLVRQPGGSYSYDVSVALSADSGEHWGTPVAPHRDGTRTEHGFVSLFPWNGGVGAVWLDGRNTAADPAGASDKKSAGPDGGMTLRFTRLDPDGSLHEEAEIDTLVCDCCQTAAAVAADGPVVAYRDRTPGEIRDIVVTRLGGEGWTAPIPVGNDQWLLPGCPVNGPAIAARGTQVVVAWYTAPQSQPRVQLARSTDSGRSFGPPVLIEGNANVGRVDVALTPDDTAVVSWLGKAEDGTGEIRIREVARDGLAGPVAVVATTSSARAAGFPQMVGTRAGLLFAWTEPGEPSLVHTAHARPD